ncbi:MAG TPA: NAD(P)/FAD-dependent oxidoreductase [Vicinamibacterales bacterium]|nr:NAD(P)/FAD-dependent oxidoreductase [Vicinamibacterales bacterium]
MTEPVDVLVAGAGPAGTVAATLLARAGASVRLVDRARFPRDKLCGDTLNPGALAALRQLALAPPGLARGLRLEGMRVSGSGVSVDCRYPRGLYGVAILRRDLDQGLLEIACAAGVQFEERVSVRRAILEGGPRRPRVAGLVVAPADGRSGETPMRARVTIAADGRRSTLAFGLGLARHPAAPRRWAVGGYFDGVAGLSSLGEMHIRGGYYLGMAPVPGGLTNVCLVASPGGGTAFDRRFGDPVDLLRTAMAIDPAIALRCAAARPAGRPVVLGPLAVDVRAAAIDGLLLAGDAAGFIDPMTGDGLGFAIRGGELAARAAVEALSSGWDGVHRRLAARRRRRFAAKRGFNRSLRTIVGSPAAVQAAAWGVMLAPSALRFVIRIAGDTWAAGDAVCGPAAREAW